PAVRRPAGSLGGVEAVVDKDLASALLADRLGAEILLILTGVEHVAVDFGRPTPRHLHELDACTLAPPPRGPPPPPPASSPPAACPPRSRPPYGSWRGAVAGPSSPPPSCPRRPWPARS